MVKVVKGQPESSPDVLKTNNIQATSDNFHSKHDVNKTIDGVNTTSIGLINNNNDEESDTSLEKKKSSGNFSSEFKSENAPNKISFCKLNPHDIKAPE